ncbi:MAG: winged helix-turn-helix domain-containing protein [Pyrinomonadaceae bacterium]
MENPPRRFYQFDSFRVDVTERRLWRDEKPILLTPKVFDMLLVLLENKGQTVEKEELIRRVWEDTYVGEGSLNRNISTLRKALGDDSNQQRFIKTLPKRGYRFTGNVEEFTEDATAESVAERELQTEAETPLSASSRMKKLKIALAALAVLVLTPALIWMLNRPARERVDLTGLTENERRLLDQKGSAAPQAYENYVLGRTLWHGRSAEGLHRSILLLERAVKNDPDFALAHAALADAYAFDSAKWREAKRQAEEAISLDPTLGEPYATIGFVQMFWEWNLPEAGRSFRKAVLLSPDYPTAHQWYGINLVAANHNQGGAALAEMKRALELDPDSPAINADLCQMYYFLQKYDDAIAQCWKTLEKDESFINARLYLYEIYSAKGMYDEAVGEFFKAEQMRSDYSLPPEVLEKLRNAYQTGGIRAFWQTRLEYFERNSKPYAAARYYARLGEKEKALSALKKGFDERDFFFILFPPDPIFWELRNEPAFSEMVRKLRG